MAKRIQKSEGQRMVESVKAQYPEVEYIGGVGFCGPQWQEAQALFNRLKEGGR
jgi:hypothetical protein